MGRVSKRNIPACPTLFTPLQIHTRELLRFGTVSWVGWMREHTVSLQRMIEDHHSAVVVAGASLTYSGKRLFHDGETIDIDTTSSVHKKGVLIEGISAFSSLGNEFAKMKLYLRPVIIGDENSAAAKPGKLLPEIRALFDDDEISPELFPRHVKTLLPTIISSGTLLATASSPIKLHRYAMDFADQWAFMESSAFTSMNREALVLANAHVHERLMEGLSAPVAEFHIDLTKPYFILDNGSVKTSAYLFDDSLYFVHQLLGEDSTENQAHATVIEKMGHDLND